MRSHIAYMSLAVVELVVDESRSAAFCFQVDRDHSQLVITNSHYTQTLNVTSRQDCFWDGLFNKHTKLYEDILNRHL